MPVLYRVQARLLACFVAGAAALGALVFAPSVGASNLGNTYLALGDSLAYGYHQAQFQKELKEKGFVEPATFNDGYVDDFGAALKLSNPKNSTINDGCPGETTETFIKGSGKAGYCAGGPTGTPFPYAFLHHAYSTTSQLEDAVAILKEKPSVSPITLDIGANDVLQFLAHTCGFPKEYTCTEKQVAEEFFKIAENVTFILGQLHAAAPTAKILLIGNYNPYPLVLPPPGGDKSAAFLNSLLGPGPGSSSALVPGTSFVNPEPSFNPSIVSKGPESEDIPTICAYTGMCPGGKYNPESSEADIHPTTLGYKVMAELLQAAFPAPHWTGDAALIGSEPRTVLSWGTLMLKTAGGGAGEVVCHTAGVGTVANPVGKGPGVGATELLATLRCESTTCPFTSVVTAEALPSVSVLQQEGTTIRVKGTGGKIKVECRKEGKTESSETFVGTTQPVSKPGTSALHPGVLEFGAGSGELEAEGSGGTITATIEGEVKTLGYEEQELINTNTK